MKRISKYNEGKRKGLKIAGTNKHCARGNALAHTRTWHRTWRFPKRHEQIKLAREENFLAAVLAATSDVDWPRTRPLGPRPRPPDFAGKKKKKKFGTQPQTPRPLSDFSPVHTHTSYRVFPVWLTHQTPIIKNNLSFRLMNPGAPPLE